MTCTSISDRKNSMHPYFCQENHVKSSYMVLRGLHYQLKFPQGKLVRCLSGNIMDVIVDIRTGSPTFSKHTSIEISEYNRLIVYIPEGYAHGYIVKSNN